MLMVRTRTKFTVMLMALLIAGFLLSSCGAKKPTVVVEAYYPLNEGHQFIVDYLHEIEKANAGKVMVTIYDMQEEEGRKKWADSGLSCAGIFVNGSTHHEIIKDGKTESVDFLQRLDVFFAREDFETVIKTILENAGQSFSPPAKQPPSSQPETTRPAEEGAGLTPP